MTTTQKPKARKAHCAIVQEALIGYVKSQPVGSERIANEIGQKLSDAMGKAVIARLEGGEYTREQVANASIIVAMSYFRGLVATGLWEFFPHDKCSPEVENYINAAKDAVK